MSFKTFSCKANLLGLNYCWWTGLIKKNNVLSCCWKNPCEKFEVYTSNSKFHAPKTNQQLITTRPWGWRFATKIQHVMSSSPWTWQLDYESVILCSRWTPSIISNSYRFFRVLPGEVASYFRMPKEMSLPPTFDKDWVKLPWEGKKRGSGNTVARAWSDQRARGLSRNCFINRLITHRMKSLRMNGQEHRVN